MVITGIPTGLPATPGTEPDRDQERLIRALIIEARRRHRRRLAVLGSTALAVVVLSGLAVGIVLGDGGGTGGGRSGTHAPTGVFSRPTGVVLVFADGLGLDLDHRVAGRQPIAGQRAGDQRWDIVRTGDSLVVGWGEVWATSIARGSARNLGSVVTFVPAAEPNAVWLVDYPGGRIGEGTPTLREVTTAGRTLRTELGPPPSAGVPTIGVPGGLAFETGSGVALWDATTRRFTRRLGHEAGFVGDAAGRSLAWCEGLCRSLHVTDVRGSDRVFSSPQADQSFQTDSLRLSPDGSHVAVIITRPGLQTADQTGTLEVLDTRTGRFTTVRRRLPVWSTLAWSSDGRKLFFASDAHRGMTIGQFQAPAGPVSVAHVPLTNAEPFVVLNRPAAGAFLTRIHRSGTCPSEAITPGVPSPACGSLSF